MGKKHYLILSEKLHPYPICSVIFCKDSKGSLGVMALIKILVHTFSFS